MIRAGPRAGTVVRRRRPRETQQGRDLPNYSPEVTVAGSVKHPATIAATELLDALVRTRSQ